MVHTLDELDRSIVALLQRDGRAPNVVIARELGLSEGTVRKRIKRLLSGGVIRVTAVVDPTRLNLGTPVLISIEADVTRLQEIGECLAAMPEVCSVKLVTGAFDLVAEAALSSSDRLLPFLIDRVAAIPGVKRTETCHVLKDIKQACDWVIPVEPGGGQEESPQRSGRPESVIPGAIVVPS